MRKPLGTRKIARSGKSAAGLRARSPQTSRRRRDRKTKCTERSAGSSTLPAYHCLERLLYPCGASTYFGWRSVQGGSYGTGPAGRKRPPRRKTARSGKSCQAVCPSHLRAILGPAGSGVRAAEGARLEIAWAGSTRLEGSNPSHSVSTSRRRSGRPLAFRGVSRAYSSAGERPLHTREVLGSIPSTPIACPKESAFGSGVPSDRRSVNTLAAYLGRFARDNRA